MADTIAQRVERKPAHPELLLKKLGFPGCWYYPQREGLVHDGNVPFVTLAGQFAGGT